MRDNHYTKETVIDEVEIPGKIETIFLYVDQRNTLKRQLGLVAQRITRLTTDQKIAGSNPAEIDIFWVRYDTMLENSVAFTKCCAPPGGLEPPTFRLTAERASQLRHGGMLNTLFGRKHFEH